jgi:hypothetical protein
MFHSGQIDKVDGDVPLECGCPPPRAVLMADAPPAQILPGSEVPKAVMGAGSAGNSTSNNAATSRGAGTQLTNGPETAPLPASQPNDVHVQVDAPLVFSAKDHAAKIAPPPAPAQAPPDLPTDQSTPQQVHVDPVIQPAPPAEPQKKTDHPGFFRRVGKFFSAIFH